MSSSDHSFILDDCHSNYHSPITTYKESGFTSLDLNRSISHSSNLCRIVETLQTSLIVMLSPHCLDTTIENDKIYFSLQDSHHNPMVLIENSYF